MMVVSSDQRCVVCPQLCTSRIRDTQGILYASIYDSFSHLQEQLLNICQMEILVSCLHTILAYEDGNGRVIEPLNGVSRLLYSVSHTPRPSFEKLNTVSFF